MPELAEVRIMSEFINDIADKELFFERVEKSPVSKVKTDLEVFDGGVFTVTSQSRGKEMMIVLEKVGGGPDGSEFKKMKVTLGMSGNWIYLKAGIPEEEQILKHCHLRFVSTRGNYLALYDVRRFAKWSWTEGWDKNRGPCPLTEHTEFRKHIKEKLTKHRYKDAPLNELLMNQSFFNGIGNYLRAEVLQRLDVNPFQKFSELSESNVNILLDLCKKCCKEAYILGGGQLKDWSNPTGLDGKSFDLWRQCYGKGLSVNDKTGRRFWYDPKWEEFVPDEYKEKE